MAGERTESFSQTSASWEVYKDAFAPPPLPRPRSKPWERAPVSAHAPRLHGQKIWKKAGLKLQQHGDKENDDAAQAELEKEGRGARKKARILGAKENISNAPWQPPKVVADESLKGLNSVATPSKKDRKSIIVGSPDQLQVIPKKRTNANHLITPRKPSLKVPPNDLAWAVAQVSRESPLKVALHDAVELGGTTDIPQRSPEKSARRRKSLRKSTRRLTRDDVSEGHNAATTENLTKSEIASERPLAAIEVVKNEAHTSNEVPTVQTLDELLKPTEILQGQETIASDTSKELGSPALPEKREIPIQSDKGTANDIKNMPLSPTAQDLRVEEQYQQVTTGESQRELQILRPELVVLESVEIASNPPSPMKASSTPKLRKRANSQRRGNRRSTRATDASTVPADDHTLEYNPPVEGTKATAGVPSEQNESAPEEHIRVTQKDSDIPSADSDKVQSQEAEPPVEQREVQTYGAPVLEPAAEPEKIDHFKTHENLDNIHPTPTIPEPAPENGVSSHEEETEEKAESHDTTQLSPDEPFEDETMTEDLQIAEPEPDVCLALPTKYKVLASSLVKPTQIIEPSSAAEPMSDDITDEDLEVFEPIFISTAAESVLDNTTTEIEDLPETSTPDPSTTDLVEAISENAPSTTYDHDDTDLLRNFLTRVKANKEAKAKTTTKRKRSYPHSPIRLPLGAADTNLSPSSPQSKDEFEVSLPAPSTKRRKRNDVPAEEEDMTEPRSIRRSGRTRLPIKAAAAAPSFIPVRRLGQDCDNTVTLKRSEEKELAALTRVNTRKNKGGALSPLEMLAKKAEEKDDPAARQRALKEKFDEKSQKQKQKKGKTVVWAEELAQYQTADGKKAEIEKEPEKEREKPLAEEKKGAVRVGVKSSRISLGMAVNETPAPKRRIRERS